MDGGSTPPSRLFILSIYLSRYAAIWTGDNTADWGHLEAIYPIYLSYLSCIIYPIYLSCIIYPIYLSYQSILSYLSCIIYPSRYAAIWTGDNTADWGHLEAIYPILTILYYLSCIIYPSRYAAIWTGDNTADSGYLEAIYPIYLSYLSILSIYPIYLSYLSILSIYLIYPSYLIYPVLFILPFYLSRYAAIWTGDNTADWGHLEASVPMCLSFSGTFDKTIWKR